MMHVAWRVPYLPEVAAACLMLMSACSLGVCMQNWLPYLDDGSLDHSEAAVLPDLEALSSSSSTSSSSSSGSNPDVLQNEDRLLDIADINARVLQEDDRLAAEGLAGVEGEPHTLVGIWPEAGLLQHSCSPNTTVLAHKVSSAGCQTTQHSTALHSTAPLQSKQSSGGARWAFPSTINS
jgi:hypothetical protein